jgi:hypothetical protein
MKLLALMDVLLFMKIFVAQGFYPYSKWTHEELALARNSNINSLLDSTENQLLLYVNLVRLKPKLFSETYLQEYIDKNQIIASNQYVSSLFTALNE